MYLCMCVCVCVCLYAYTNIYTYTWAPLGSLRSCVHVCVYVCMHWHTSDSTYISWMQIRTRWRTHKHTHTHTSAFQPVHGIFRSFIKWRILEPRIPVRRWNLSVMRTYAHVRHKPTWIHKCTHTYAHAPYLHRANQFMASSDVSQNVEYMSHEAIMTPVLPLPPLQCTAMTLCSCVSKRVNMHVLVHWYLQI